MSVYQDIRNVFFIGIGGIGMSALARYFHAQGKHVGGYDRNPSDITRKLEQEGIRVIYSGLTTDLPERFLEDHECLIVYTPAIPSDHQQYLHFVANGYNMEKRAVVLGNLTKGYYTLAVAGTHGKTTTSTMLAHLLKASGGEITAFLGGISENYGSNLILDGNQAMVVEADEYDRSFLHLNPDLAAITSMDADHLDIYGEDAVIKQSFRDFASRISGDGKLFFSKGLPLEGLSIGIEEDADYAAVDVLTEQGWYHFDLVRSGEKIGAFKLNLPGKHNLQNAVTALAMALEYGIAPDKLQEALASFKGVNRRFSYRVNTKNKVLIDDYAHHPAEIEAVHQAVREMHPGQKVLAVFQPHLYSRTRDFAAGFAQSLSLFDQILLLDIYPAREKPIEGINSRWLLEMIKNGHKELVTKAELADKILGTDAQVVLMMGAGDIGEEVANIKILLTDEG